MADDLSDFGESSDCARADIRVTETSRTARKVTAKLIAVNGLMAMSNSTQVWPVILLGSICLMTFLGVDWAVAQSSANPRFSGSPRLPSSSAAVSRAQQAIWHSSPQGTKKRPPARQLGYVPKHERMASGSPDVAAFANPPLESGNSTSGLEPWVDGEPIAPTRRVGSAPLAYGDEVIGEGTWAEDVPPNADDVYAEDGLYFDDEGYHCDGCPCDQCMGVGSCGPWTSLLEQGNIILAAGVQGFTNPVNDGSSGSFGFHQAVNYGGPLPFLGNSGFGVQLGVRTLQSNLSGSALTDEERTQTFFTTGAFRRTTCGLQGGLVFDMFRDDWFTEIQVNQLRGEFSYRFPSRHEWGYRFASGGSTDVAGAPQGNGTVTWGTHGLHKFFYRSRLWRCPGSMGSLYAGFTGGQDGLIGSDAFLPLNHILGLQTSYTYLVPRESRGQGGAANEAWNLSLSLVFNLRGTGPQRESIFTPFLEVADNGSFIVDRK